MIDFKIIDWSVLSSSSVYKNTVLRTIVHNVLQYFQNNNKKHISDECKAALLLCAAFYILIAKKALLTCLKQKNW